MLANDPRMIELSRRLLLKKNDPDKLSPEEFQTEIARLVTEDVAASTSRPGRKPNPNAKPRNPNAVRRVKEELPEGFLPLDRLPIPFHTESKGRFLTSAYVQLPTHEILNGLRDVGWAPYAGRGTYNLRVQPNSRGVESGRDPSHARHIVTLRHVDMTVETVALHDRFVQAYLQNSHDGTCRLTFNLGIWEKVCTNGAIAQRSGFGVQVKHMNTSLSDVIRNFQALAGNAPIMLEQANILSRVEMSQVQAMEFARRALPLRWTNRETGELDENAPSPDNLLTSAYAAQSTPTIWNVFENVQRNMLNGGFHRPANTKAKVTKVRAVAGLQGFVAVNTGLDSLLAEFVADEFPNIELPQPTDLGSFDDPIDAAVVD